MRIAECGIRNIEILFSGFVFEFLNSALRTRQSNDEKGLQEMGVGLDRRKGSFRCADEAFHIDESGRAGGQPFVSKERG